MTGCAVQVFEAATGTRLLSSMEVSEARKAAEKSAEAAEAELVRLRAEIERLGRTRAIISRCESAAAVELGQAAGIHLFEGLRIDRMLAAGRAVLPVDVVVC